eukprot:m.102077 g.102077  ORF g.102077 m.102077 type:complete len:432 (+) comp10423_c0_seq1:532-1827(+)
MSSVRPRTPARLPPISPSALPISPAPSPFETNAETTGNELASALNAAHDTAKDQLTAAIQAVHDLASRLEGRVASEIGTLKKTSHTVAQHLTQQLQEAHDRCVASDIVVQAKDYELVQCAKVESDLQRTVNQLQHSLEHERAQRKRAETTLTEERATQASKVETLEKHHTSRLQDLASAHREAVDTLKKSHSDDRQRAAAQLDATRQELQARIDDYAHRLAASQSAGDELNAKLATLAGEHKAVQDDLKSMMRRSKDDAMAHANEMARLKEDFQAQVEALTQQLADKHTRAELELRAEAANAAQRAENRHAELLADHERTLKRLELVETANVQLQNDLKSEIRKAADADKEHSNALQAAMDDAAASLERVKERLTQEHEAQVADMKRQHVQEVGKLEERLNVAAKKQEETTARTDALLAEERTRQHRLKLS